MGLMSFFGRTFRHGIHPPENKGGTAGVPIRRLAFPPRLIVHLDQFIGRPAKPVVRKGQEVVRGQPIAEPDGFMSVPLFAPATGRVRDIGLMPSARGPRSMAIVIDVHEASSQRVRWARPPNNLEEMDREELIRAIQNTGLTGLGGAAFPMHVKYASPPDDDTLPDTLVVNGAECEPWLTADHRVMLEQPEDLLRGIRYALKASGAQRAVIGIEDNKRDAAEVLRRHLKPDDPIRVELVETKYPQGAEKMLIYTLLGRKVPAGGLPRQVGVVVSNAGTLAQLGYLLPRGEGLVERVVTVAGPGVERPGNYRVPIGTPARFILQEAGLRTGNAEIIFGGPMMGLDVPELDVPVTMGTSGVLVREDGDGEKRIWPCIKCARCVDACPMFLNPSMLGQLAQARRYEEMQERYNLLDCFECGCCTYVCPSNIPLVQHFRIAKAINRERAQAE